MKIKKFKIILELYIKAVTMVGLGLGGIYYEQLKNES